MADRRFLISPGTNTTLAQVQDLVEEVLRQAQTPGTSAHREAAALLSSEPEFHSLRPDELQIELRPVEQHLDPASGVIFVAGWVGAQVAGKLFDVFWDRIVKPQIDKRWGAGAVVAKVPSSDSAGGPNAD